MIYAPLALAIGFVFDRLLNLHKTLFSFAFLILIISSMYVSFLDSKYPKYVTYKQNLEAVFLIANDFEGQEIDLVYSGPNDQFEAGGSQFEYLLYENNIQINTNSKNTVVISQEPNILPINYTYSKVYNLNTIQIGYIAK